MKQFILLMFGLLVVGCGVPKEMFSDLHIEANTSLPLGKLSFTDSTLFALAGDFSSQMRVGQDHVLTVVLDDSLTLVDDAKFNVVFHMPDQVKAFDITIPTIAGTQITVPDGTVINYTLVVPNNERIDSVIFDRGSIIVDLEGGYDNSGLRVTFEQIVNVVTGRPLTVPIGVKVPLTKLYAVVPTQSEGITNGLRMSFSGTIPAAGALKGEARISFDGLKYAKGYFGRKEILSPSITISTTPEFAEFTDMIDYLYFDNPKIAFNIVNEYDAPMLLVIDTLEISGKALNLVPGANRFFVDARAQTKLVITNANTESGKQISELLNKNFNRFKVDVNTIMNPTKAEVGSLKPSYVEPLSNSFSSSNSVFGSYAMGIPLDGVLENVHFEQELDVDLSSLNSSTSTVREFAFAFSGKNYMPLDITINAFVREGDRPDGAKILLFSEPVVIQASLNNAIQSTPSVIDGTNRRIVDIKSDALDVMLASKKVYLELTTSTKNAGKRENIKIFSPSSVDLGLQIGAKVDLLIGGNKN